MRLQCVVSMKKVIVACIRWGIFSRDKAYSARLVVLYEAMIGLHLEYCGSGHHKNLQQVKRRPLAFKRMMTLLYRKKIKGT